MNAILRERIKTCWAIFAFSQMILYLMTFLCLVINFYMTLIDVKVEKAKQVEDNPKTSKSVY